MCSQDKTSLCCSNNIDDEEENCSKIAKNLEQTCGKGKRKQSANEDEDGKRSNFVIDRKMIKRTIVALLETFSKFRTPKTIYMEREIRQLYDQLLLVPDEAIQKAVVKCLLAYKYKFLTPYKLVC
ncbi:unnamed protein product [Anisakis simplex]|uniref:DRIM domain-containing protein n=1 Tax=Anisakis simplex TaxID=6269 RepID=A0A0M3KJT0_ANISI|nr:unnamed protein product [Anisakis simplex]